MKNTIIKRNQRLTVKDLVITGIFSALFVVVTVIGG